MLFGNSTIVLCCFDNEAGHLSNIRYFIMQTKLLV